MEPTKNAHGIDLTETDANSVMLIGLPEITEKAFLTSIPAEIIIIGIKTAQRKPITDCLYFTFISLQANMYKRCLY
jgi:hypothetical protein